MKILLLLLSGLSASAQLAITEYQFGGAGGKSQLYIGWTNANPAYPLYFLASSNLATPSTNWTVLLDDAVPLAQSTSNSHAIFNYTTQTVGRQVVVGLHDTFYTLNPPVITPVGWETNIVYSGSTDPTVLPVPISTNYLYISVAITNQSTNFNCFFRLYQPIPAPVPVTVNQAAPFENFTAGLFLSMVIFRLRV